MLEIIIIIAVVRGFSSVAEKKGRSKVLWGFIGALSYYVPILLMSFLILPIMMDAGMLPFITLDNAFFIGILINLASGVACCFAAYLVLRGLSNLKEDARLQSAYDPTFEQTPIKNPTDDNNPYRPSL
ncbi:MAG: hypothetical protein AAFN77_22100 [Planctomycetota bacterium]